MFRKYVGMGYGEHLSGIVVDQSYKSLQDLIEKSKRWFYAFNDGAVFLASSSQLKWRWPTGETLSFRVLDSEAAYWNLHGSEFPIQLFNEITKYPDFELIDKMASLCRSGFVPEVHGPRDADGNPILIPDMPLQQIFSTNPAGVGHNAVKKRFIDPARYGEVVKIETEVFNPRTKKDEIVTKTQVAIHSSYKDNPYLSPEYVAELENIDDPQLRKAWLEGSWEITSGGLLDDCWRAEYNIIKPFKIPEGYKVWRGFDYGSSAPYCALIFAESDGAPIRFNDDTMMHTVKGDIIVYSEVYGWNQTPNKGLRELPAQIAMAIVRNEVALGLHERIKPGPCDSSIFYDGNTGASIAQDMAEANFTIAGKHYNGPQYVKADKRPGSRLAGLQKIRTALVNAWPNEDGSARTKPGLFVVNTCQDGIIRTVPTLARDPKNPDDCHKLSEDHCFTADTRVLLADGTKPRLDELIGQTGLIQTDQGPKQFTRARLVKKDQPTIKLTFSDGSVVRCTPDHKFMTTNGDWVLAQDINRYTELKQVSNLCNNQSSSVKPFKNLTDNVTIYVSTIFNVKALDYIGKFTKKISDLFQKDSISTTKTKTKQTITQRIYSALKDQSTYHYTNRTIWPILRNWSELESTLTISDNLQKNGTHQKKVERGIENTTKQLSEQLLRQLKKISTVSNAVSSAMDLRTHNFVLTPANQHGVETQELMTLPAPVLNANRISPSTSTERPLRVVESVPDKNADVYCLTVPELGRFALANGVIVHNCYDTIRYTMNAIGGRFEHTQKVTMGHY